jgi:hypothetical protein
MGYTTKAPAEYVEFDIRRALWKELGLHPEDMTAREYTQARTFLRLEAHYRKVNENN